MNEGNTTSAAAPPTVETFAGALSAFNQARDAYERARAALEAGERALVAAVNELPPEARADMAQIEAAGDRARIVGLGEELSQSVLDANAALEALMAIPAQTPLDLFEKMGAAFSAEWEGGDHSARLLADAGNMSLLFGHVWLSRWTERGGSVTPDVTDPAKVWIGHVTYPLSPIAVEDEARMDAGGLAEDHRDEQRRWHATFFDGKMRELSDFLDAMPGGSAAVKAIVLTNPSLGAPRTAADAEKAVRHGA